MKILKNKEIKPIYDPIYPLLGPNGRWKWLNCYGGSNGILWGTFCVKMLPFKGIHRVPYDKHLNISAKNNKIKPI